MTTPTSRIQQTIAKYRADLLAQEAEAVAQLEHYHQYTIDNYIKPRLQKLYDDILKKQNEIIANRDPDDTSPPKIPQYWIEERIRLEGLQLQIEGKIDNFGALSLQETRRLQHLGVQLGLDSAKDQINTLVPPEMRAIINKYLPTSKKIGAAFGQPSDKALNDLIGATQAGSPLGDLFNGFGSEAADKAIKELVSGVTMGDNPRTIAPRIAKALDISRQRALTISRNEALRCYKSAALETYRANDDVCGSWIWLADMTDRTCLACILLNGTEHPLSEDMQSHICCRCSPSPKTHSFVDILGGLGIDSSGIEETGLSVPSGEDWFLQQSEETQRSIMGNLAYETWKNNDDINLNDFVGKSSDPDWGDSIYQRSVKQVLARR
jgi:SPP1 gp7 family putative phage head morphogenesis protein